MIKLLLLFILSGPLYADSLITDQNIYFRDSGNTARIAMEEDPKCMVNGLDTCIYNIEAHSYERPADFILFEKKGNDLVTIFDDCNELVTKTQFEYLPPRTGLWYLTIERCYDETNCSTEVADTRNSINTLTGCNSGGWFIYKYIDKPSGIQFN